MQFLVLSSCECLTEGLSFQGCAGGSSGFKDCVAGGWALWLPEMF
jgi:hypothetical protein